MHTVFDFESLRVSWTKYDIVHALDIFESKETLEEYYSGEAVLDRPILRAVLGITSDNQPIPEFWYEVIDKLDDKEKKFFVFFAILFTNSRILRSFVAYYDAPFKGVYYLDKGKEGTNIRSLLVESGLASSSMRRKEIVPFDGSILLNSITAGQLFKKYLHNLLLSHSIDYDSNEFEEICRDNQFNTFLGLPFERFMNWLDGVGLIPKSCMYLQFEDFLCFQGLNRLFIGDSKEVYLVGENGDGKTLLLYLIFLAFKGAQMQRSFDVKDIGLAISWMNKCQNELLGLDDLEQMYTLQSAPVFKNFYAYGTHRGLYASDSDEFIEPHGFMTLFDNNLKLIDPINWLKDLYFRSQNHEIRHENSFDSVSTILSSLLEDKVYVVVEGTDVFFMEKDYRLTLDMLSEGYRGVIIMACDLLARLMDNNGYNENVFDATGVVLIDEICQHLHPRWQREIVTKLRGIFRNIQFIVTTHSPFVIQGASDEAIAFRVYRENGRAYISDRYEIREMKDMMLNTLATSSMFGVDSAAMYGSENIDTSLSDVMSRVNKKIKEELEQLRQNGRNYIPDEELDEIIRKAME